MLQKYIDTNKKLEQNNSYSTMLTDQCLSGFLTTMTFSTEVPESVKTNKKLTFLSFSESKEIMIFKSSIVHVSGPAQTLPGTYPGFRSGEGDS